MTITEIFDTFRTGGHLMWVKPLVGYGIGRIFPVDQIVEGVGVYAVVPGLEYRPFWYTFEYEVVQREEKAQEPKEE